MLAAKFSKLDELWIIATIDWE